MRKFIAMIYKLLFLSFLFSFSFNCSFAQNNRRPTEAEMTAINKAVNVIVPLVDRFQNETWQKEEGGADAPENYSVQKHPNVVMGVAPFNDWHFTIRQNSDYYNEKIKPYYDKITNNQIPVNDPKAMGALQKEGQKIKLESNLYVEVHVNDAGIPINPAKKSLADLKIPGCYFAYKQQPDNLIGTDRNIPDSYVLAFGKWENAKYNANLNEYYFKFGHPPGTPYIENIVIILSGPPDRLQELLKTTDWKSVDEGLTN